MRRLSTALLAGVLGVAGGLAAVAPTTPAVVAVAPTAAETRAAADETRSARPIELRSAGRSNCARSSRAPRHAIPGRGGDSSTDPAPRAAGPVMAKPGENLLVNSNAETGGCTTSGYDAMTLPGWQVTKGSPNALCYGVEGFVPQSLAHGRAYFAGGSTGDASMDQLIDVSAVLGRDRRRAGRLRPGRRSRRLVRSERSGPVRSGLRSW